MSRPPRTPPPVRFVYVIGPAEGLQKIGLATDPEIRLAALQTGNPVALQIHVAVRVPFGEAHAIERLAHGLLARSRVRSEWFDTTPSEAITAVQAAAAARKVPVGQGSPRLEALPLFAFRGDLFDVHPAEKVSEPSNVKVR